MKYKPQDWQTILGVEILDPDGWDRRGDKFDADWNKPLTLDEFLTKAEMSTARGLADREIMHERFLEYYHAWSDNTPDPLHDSAAYE